MQAPGSQVGGGGGGALKFKKWPRDGSFLVREMGGLKPMGGLNF